MRHAALPLALTALAVLLSACSLDGLLLTELTRKGHNQVPDPAPVYLQGRVPSMPGASVRLLGSGGQSLGKGSAVASAEGKFTLELDGTTDLAGTVIEARMAARQLLGVVPFIPGQVSVLDPASTLDMATLSPGLIRLEERTTALALLLVAKARQKSSTLASIPHGSLTDTMIELHQRLVDGDAKLALVEQMVQRLVAGAPTAGGDVKAAFDVSASGTELLRAEFLTAAAVDYTGNGAADGSAKAFDDAVAAALATFDFKACYAPDRIRVVLLARLATGAKNTSCDPVDPFLWADDKPTSRMFIAGGVHPDTPVCDSQRTTHCLTAKQIDATNATFGNWKPNRTPMYDDGSHGDAQAGDGIWTFSFESPWWRVEEAPDKAGVRLAYKFTWGSDGKGWSSTEEFPGNQRILELKDVNGDGMIVRLDLFADEASNKDKANELAPSLGGCGELKWPTEVTEGCKTDVHERPADLDGDCVPDGWPSSGTAAPFTITCPGS